MTGPEQQWREALAEGRLVFQRSRASGTVFFPPRITEPGTGDSDWEWVEAPSPATVYSVTVIPSRTGPATAVALVDFDGGGRMMGNVVGIDAESVAIGMRVNVLVDRTGDAPRVQFDASRAAR